MVDGKTGRTGELVAEGAIQARNDAQERARTEAAAAEARVSNTEQSIRVGERRRKKCVSCVVCYSDVETNATGSARCEVCKKTVRVPRCRRVSQANPQFVTARLTDDLIYTGGVMEKLGIDPSTSRMLSERSTI